MSTSPTTHSDEPISEKISTTASGILDKAKETASGTYDAVASQATTKIEERKGELSSGLRTLADTFRKTGTDLGQTPQSTPLTEVTARYTGTAANQIEKVASYFERKDLRAMMSDAERRLARMLVATSPTRSCPATRHCRPGSISYGRIRR